MAKLDFYIKSRKIEPPIGDVYHWGTTVNIVRVVNGEIIETKEFWGKTRMGAEQKAEKYGREKVGDLSRG